MTDTANVSDATALSPPIARLAQSLDLRANSLLITIFGDSVLPRGGRIWLGSLIALAAPFGISERLVRTGVYRLAREGWLQSETSGRRAHYTLTPSGQTKFADADRRIYTTEAPVWNGDWTLIQMLPGVEQKDRQTVRREFTWQGFGQLSSTLLAHPTAPPPFIADRLDELGMRDSTLVFSARIADLVAPETLRDAAATAWSLETLNREYGAFHDQFAPLRNGADLLADLTPLDCFVLRTLLIHDYRRILLKDPLLPDALLPESWRGGEARDLCRAIYLEIAERADAHLVSEMAAGQSAIDGPAAAYLARFGGLPR